MGVIALIGVLVEVNFSLLESPELGSPRGMGQLHYDEGWLLLVEIVSEQFKCD